MKIWTEHLTEHLQGEIFIIPGGKGARRFVKQDDCVRKLLKEAAEKIAAEIGYAWNPEEEEGIYR